MEIEGDGAENLKNEIGGHRIQRIPPFTERHGRVHSSTVTVSVLIEQNISSPYLKRSENEYLIEWTNGTGKGGQFRNKVATTARVRHIPTGIIKIASTRSRENSLKNAMSALNLELDKLALENRNSSTNFIRKNQIGSGERSDKRRTIRFTDNMVIDHENDKRMPADIYMKGNMDRLW